MEPRKQNVTQTAIHVPQGEGESLWTVGQLLTFKIQSDQSETVRIFEIEVPPEGAAPPHLHPTQDETHYILEGQCPANWRRRVSHALGREGPLTSLLATLPTGDPRNAWEPVVV